MAARELSNTNPETEHNSLLTQGLDVIPDDRNSLLRRETSRPCVVRECYQSLTAHQHQKGHTVPKQVITIRTSIQVTTV